MSFSPAILAKHHKDTKNLRNICILAHVDHGKTTLADALLATNGIISPRMAGQMRYMDSREDEQRRGITMKSSAVTLLHRYGAEKAIHLINVIDSPGHVDFSIEVSTAVRMSDGAVVLVDVVEGVSAQTHAVLRQAWQEKLKPCLVLNKIDRLILELQLTPNEAYHHLRNILEQVNAITAGLFSSELLTEQEAIDNENDDAADSSEADAMFEEAYEKEEHLYFEPEKGNVVFASAIDGWGFTTAHIAETIAAKLGCRPEKLAKCLWGDYYLTKTKAGIKVKFGASTQGKTTLFEKFVLSTVWDVYSAVSLNRDKQKIGKIISQLNLKVSARALQEQDPRPLLIAIMGQWQPLARAVMDVVCHVLPHPGEMQESRALKLLYGTRTKRSTLPQMSQDLEHHVLHSQHSDDCPIVAYVSKMVSVERSSFPENKRNNVTDAETLKKRRELALARRAAREQGLPEPQMEDILKKDNTLEEADTDSSKQVFVAYVRVFSGILKPESEIYVIHPKHNPLHPEKHLEKVKIGKLYLFMGRDLLAINEAAAGTVVGVVGLESHVFKSATLSSTPYCPSLVGLHVDAKPVVRVALETASIKDMSLLKKGLELLNQADPGVEITVQKTGEHILAATGEVHIERCLTDLREIFVPDHVEIIVSPPIIPFRETVVEPPKVDQTNEAINAENTVADVENFLLGDNVDVDDERIVTVTTANKRWNIRVRARPLPEDVLEVIMANTDIIDVLYQASVLSRERIRRAIYPLLHQSSENMSDTMDKPTLAQEDEEVADQIDDVDVSEQTISEVLRQFEEEFVGIMTNHGQLWSSLLSKNIMCFGPKSTGLNILTCSMPSLEVASLWKASLNSDYLTHEDLSENLELLRFINGFAVAFEVLCTSGPLCEEPLHGVCFEIVDVLFNDEMEAFAPGFDGQVIAAAKESYRQAFLVQPTRLMTAMLKCDLYVKSASLGKVYGVISKRNGKIISEDMKESSDSFVVSCLVPVTDSFGFAEELRKRTSGLAVPQLVFSHWQTLDEDPFWVPSTEEEKIHYGDKGDAPNLARKFMFDTRKRKGLAVEEKVVEHAEKQRTQSKKK